MGKAPPSSVLWRSLVLTPGAESPPGPPQASPLALRALTVLSPGRGARPWGCPCCCPCCSWHLCRLVSGWACPALPGTLGRGCGWVCVEGPPGVAGQASHPQQTEGVPQCGVSQPLTLLLAPSLERITQARRKASPTPCHTSHPHVAEGTRWPGVTFRVSPPPSSRLLGGT